MQQKYTNNIPVNLKNRQQWIILSEENESCYNEASKRIPQDINELLSFEEAYSLLDSNSLNKLGFVLTKEDPFVAVIVEGCVNREGDLNNFALSILNQIDSYTEYQYGGIQIICEAVLPSGNQNKPLIGLEIIDNGIISFTGDVIYGNEEINENTKGIVQLYNKYFNNSINQQQTIEIHETKPSYKEVIETLSKMEQGNKLIDLLNGKWCLYYDSPIEADLALCTALATATNNSKELIIETFRQSKSFRSSWYQEYYHKGTTYGEEIIKQALNASIKKEIVNDQRFLEPTNSLPSWYEKGNKGELSIIPPILAEHLADTFRIIFTNHKYYQYQNGIYHEVEMEYIKKIIQQHQFKRYAKQKEINETEKFLRTMVHQEDHVLNGESSTNLINFKNGMFNVTTKHFSPHTPQLFSSIQMNCYYNPSAEAPFFQYYLSQVLDESTLSLIQELLGYLLIPNNHAQRAFILYGPGRTGKSTFLQIIEMIIGNQNISNVSWQGLEDKFEPATLYGKLVNLYGDLPATSLKDTANFKALTGGDTINAQFKNQQIFSFKNKARLVFSCNQLPPNNVDRTDAFYRRIVLVPFINQVPVERVDPNLIQKLQKEKDGIVQWGLEGLFRLIRNDYKFSESIVANQILEQYKTNNDSVLWFMKNFCDLNIETKCYSQDLYNAYKIQSKMNGLQSKTQPQFNDDILKYSNGSVLKDKEGKTKKAIYRGISLKKS